jgi:polysaccharide export outer membrane protein
MFPSTSSASVLSPTATRWSGVKAISLRGLMSRRSLSFIVAVAALTAPAAAWAQMRPVQPPATPPTTARPLPPPLQGGRTGAPPTASTGLAVPTDYTIGPDDVLGIVFWRDADMTGDVVVRPDGMITLPLLNDIKAAGLRPDELRLKIVEAAAKLIEDPNVSVVIRQINSRNVFITGQVARPGPYPVSGEMRVLQLIAVAGGLLEFADQKNITITRVENGKTEYFKFNYKDVARGKNTDQNRVLKPGDTVVVP